MSLPDEDPGTELSDTSIQRLAQAFATAMSSQTSAGAGTAGARTQSNAEQDSKTGYQAEQVDSDTGTEEAMAGAVHDVREGWSANRKRTYDMHQSFDFARAGGIAKAESSEFSQRLANDSKLDSLDLQILQNAVANTDAAAKQAMRLAEAMQANILNAHNLAVHRMWNETRVPVASINRDVAEEGDTGG